MASTELHIGSVVWARTAGFPYWPARIIAPSSAPPTVQRLGKPNQWCFRYLPFKRNEYGWASANDIFDFSEAREAKSKQSIRKSFQSDFQEGIARAQAIVNGEVEDDVEKDDDEQEEEPAAKAEPDEESEEEEKPAKPAKRRAKAEEDADYVSDGEKKEKEKRKKAEREARAAKREESEPKKRKRVVADDEDSESKGESADVKVDVETEIKNIKEKLLQLEEEDKQACSKAADAAETLAFMLKTEKSFDIGQVSKIAETLQGHIRMHKRAVESLQSTLKRLLKSSETELLKLPNAVTLLQETGIGKVVNQLGKRSRETGITGLAETVVKQLKDIVSKAAAAPAASPADKAPAASTRAVPPSAEIKQEDGESADKTEKVESRDGQAATKPQSSPAAAQSSEDVRSKMRSKLCEAFGTEITESNYSPSAISVEIEAAVWEKCGSESTDATNAPKQYMQKGRSLIFNIQRNARLREVLLSGELSATDVVSKEAKDLAPEEMQKQRQAWAEWHKQAIMPQVGNEATTDQFKCGKCGKRETKYYQLQTRSADEPMTTFVTCTFCGHRWKFC